MTSSRTALVTGANQGLGLALVEGLADRHVLRRLGPIVRPGGRLLVVASSLGRLGHLPPATQARFSETATLDEVDAIMRDWASSARAGTAQADGWPEWLNIPSKVGQVAAVRAVARERRVRDLADGILVASVCPGLFDTPTSRPWFDDFSDAQTPPEAAVALLDLALAPDVDPALYGELVRFGRVLPWREPIAAAG